MRSLTALTATELRLLSREWASMLFAFVFPALMLVVLAGVFGDEPDEGFGAAVPSEYYVVAYVGIPMAALALIGLPVMLASYREQGVLRRFDAFGVPVGHVAAAQAVVTSALVALGAIVVLAVAAPTYGIPRLAQPVTVAAGFVLATLTMVAIGVAVGLAVQTARAAQALGLLLFLPMWLLGGGGPPRGAMPDAMILVADLLPLTYATAAIREPWLSDTSTVEHMLALILWLAAALTVTAALLRRRVH